MKIDQEIIDKLTKILRLAKDKAAQPGEIEAAMARARAIAVQHNIELASIDLTNDDKAKAAIDITKETMRTRSKHEQPYHRWIYQVLREVFEVKVIRVWYMSASGGRVVEPTLIGSPFDIAIAKEIFPFLEKIFPATLSRAVSGGQLTYSMADTNGCYEGICHGIIDTNRREEEKVVKESTNTNQNQYALVLAKKEELIEQAMDKYFPNRKARPNRARTFNPGAYHYGQQEGRKINLRQVGPATNKGQLR